VKLVHWPLMGGLLHLVQQGGDRAGPQSAQALLAVPNVTAHPSTASVRLLITVSLYNGPCVMADGGHFEHILWCFNGSVC